MTSIEIEYCDPCGLLDAAIEAQYAVLEAHGRSVDAVGLVPGHGGVFQVRVDGDVVFDKDERDGGYDLEAVSAAVAERV